VKAGAPVGLKPYNSNLPATRAALRDLRKVVDSFPGDRVMLGENAISTIEDLAGSMASIMTRSICR
jgi:alpha-glucosidase